MMSALGHPTDRALAPSPAGRPSLPLRLLDGELDGFHVFVKDLQRVGLSCGERAAGEGGPP